MTKVPAYARWLYTLTVERNESPDLDFDGCEEILAYLCIKSEANDPVNVTDLVQSRLFGTSPTVYRKAAVLTQRRLIKFVASKSDGRIKYLTLTKAGEDLLKERIKLMTSTLKA